MNPWSLNWKEIRILTQGIQKALPRSCRIDRLIVPDRPEFPEGFQKNEWALRLEARKFQGVLLICARPGKPYLGFSPTKGPKASPKATLSPFSLQLGKRLKGLKVLGIQAVENERVVRIDFEGDLCLYIELFPARADIVLVSGKKVLLSHRQRKDSHYELKSPQATKTGPDVEIRPDLELERPESFYRQINQAVFLESSTARVSLAQKKLKTRLKKTKKSVGNLKEQVEEPRSNQTQDFIRWGELLKSAMSDHPSFEAKTKTWKIKDYQTGDWVEVPGDPKLTLHQQAQSYFEKAKKSRKKKEESRRRLEELQKEEARLTQLIEKVPSNLSELGALEKAAGILQPSKEAQDKKTAGKRFLSSDGLQILVGRNLKENHELTFKTARGNDYWLHLRGQPSSHVIILLEKRKPPPLQTLIEAAQLCLYYSDGKFRGKTEVDYTQRKHVKRIKNSSQVSYSQNKTLLVEPHPKIAKELESH